MRERRSSSQARLSTVYSDPYDPAFSLQNWDQVESPTSYVPPHIPVPISAPEQTQLLPSPGFDASYPFSPVAGFPAPASSGLPPTVSPEYATSATGGTGHDIYQHTVGYGDPYRPQHAGGWASPTSPRSAYPLTPPALAAVREEPPSTSDPDYGNSPYALPGAPPPPSLPTDISYETMKSTSFRETTHSVPPSRQSSLRRLGSRIVGTVKGRHRRSGSGWGAAGNRYSGTARDESGLTEGGGGTYTELNNLDEHDEPEAVGVDLSSFGPDFAVPQATEKAMLENKWDDDKAYTGNGEVISLSNLVGLDYDGSSDWENGERDFFPLKKAGTFENTANQSYYFPPVRKIPNWKPVAMRTWFISFLLLLTISMLVATEVLYRLSNSGWFRRNEHKLEEKYRFGIFGFKDVNGLKVIQFAGWKYLPTLVGVIYGILWKVTDEGIKRGEPYYQLSKGSKGALASESLNIEYHTIWSPIVPVTALRHKQFVVAASGFLAVLASGAVPVLLSVFIRIHPSAQARKAMSKESKDIVKTLVVDVVFTRILQVCLVLITMLSIYVLVKLSRRRTGLLGDPSGVAGVAAMANKSHILMDFKGLDLATESQIHKQLNKRTYILHKGALWQAQLLKETERDNAAPKAMNPHPLLLRPKGVIPFMAYCAGMIALVPCIVENEKVNELVDRVPWVITGFSIVIKFIWELLEKELRMLEPFWILYNRDAHSSVLTLDYTATIPGFIVLKALSKKHWLLAWVCTMTLLVEVLTVVLGSLDSQSGEESKTSSSLSYGFALTILGVLILSSVLVLHLRRRAFLPRQPGTISSVLAFIHQSHMLTDFDGTEEQSTLQRKKRLAKTGKRYGFGWYVGRDGKRHLGIDQEPLLESYVFGQDPRAAVVDTLSDWQTFEPTAAV